MRGPRCGQDHVDKVRTLIKGIMLNAAFLDNEDLSILEHLSKKGLHEKEKAVLISKNKKNEN